MLNAGASNETSSSQGDNRPAGTTRRYAPLASSVSFGLARRVLPTGGWSIAILAVGAIAAVASLVVGDVYQSAVAAYLGDGARSLVDVARPTSLASWGASVLGLALIGLCGVVFGLRRQRTDDLQGVYRWWMTGVMSLAAVSLCMSTGLHQVVASLVAAKVGWSPLAGDAFWWLAPAVLGPGLVAVRLFLDLKESRLAAIAAVVATIGGGVALAAAMNWLPAFAAAHAAVIQAAALLVALVAVGVSLLGYIRRIVIEADGKIAAPAKRKSAAKQQQEQDRADSKPAAKAEKKPAAASTTKPAKPTREKQRQAKPAIASETQWVDGSQGGVDDDYGDEDAARPRKLTKAERKRLRKQKERQNRAA